MADCLASGGVGLEDPVCDYLRFKRQIDEKMCFARADVGDVTLMAILCCCLMFSRLETIYREKLWEHFRTNDHDRSCATSNIKQIGRVFQVSGEIVPEF